VKAWHAVALATPLLMVAVACSSGGSASEGSATDPGGSVAASAGGSQQGSAAPGAADVDPLVAAFEGPKVDLSGVKLVATTSEPDTLNMGAFFMMDKLRQWGADVDLVIITTTSGIQTMMAGRSDLASQGADEVVLGKSQGADIKAVGSARTKQNYVLVGKDDIKKVSDLKGRTIAMSGPSGFDTLLAKHALREAGLNVTDGKFVQIGGSPDRGTALLAGSVDAATIFTSTWEQIKPQAKNLHLLEDFAETTDFPSDAYYAKTDFINKNPDLFLGIACANLEANRWIASSEGQFVEFTERHVKGVDPAGVKFLWETATKNGMYPTEPDEVITQEGLKNLQTAMLDAGEIQQEVSLDGVVDLSFLEKAKAMGCGQSSK